MTEIKECEVKLLIQYTDEGLLKPLGIREKYLALQTYLVGTEGKNVRRVRMLTTPNGGISYRYTEKTLNDDGTNNEKEEDINCFEYLRLVESESHDELNQINKVRYLIDLGDRVIEIDRFIGISEASILEIEMPEEEFKRVTLNGEFNFESYVRSKVNKDKADKILSVIHPIKDVTFDKRFKNASLARDISALSLSEY